MNRQALRRIKGKYHKWSKTQCVKFVNKYINIIEKKYPEGIEESNYFVLPGFEHVRHNQPIIVFNQMEQQYELDAVSIFDFIKPENIN